MFVVAVTIWVKPELVDLFQSATLENARSTRLEPANIRFDILQADDDPTRFLLYECYTSAAGLAVHHQTAHYLRWKQVVADAMASPRQGIKHHAIFFGDAEVEKI